LQERLLDLLWAQWGALGVSGHVPAQRGVVIDPEALLAFSATLARHDARLFDEMLDWLGVNGQWINIQRLQRMLDTEEFAGRPVIAGIARFLGKGAARVKWARLAACEGITGTPEPLFFGPGLAPLPVLRDPDPAFAGAGLLRDGVALRGHSQAFPAESPANIILRLRALMGLSARSEIATYLLTHETGSAPEIARATCFFGRTIEDALRDMSASRLVRSRSSGRKKRYSLQQDAWRPFVFSGQEPPAWRNWPPLFLALEMIWLALRQSKLSGMEPLLLASELRLLMDKARPKLEAAGVADKLTDDTRVTGEAITGLFFKNLELLLALAEGKAPVTQRM